MMLNSGKAGGMAERTTCTITPLHKWGYDPICATIWSFSVECAKCPVNFPLYVYTVVPSFRGKFLLISRRPFSCCSSVCYCLKHLLNIAESIVAINLKSLLLRKSRRRRRLEAESVAHDIDSKKKKMERRRAAFEKDLKNGARLTEHRIRL